MRCAPTVFGLRPPPSPVLVGGGKPALPRGVRLDLELLDHRRFDNGVVYVRHAVRHPA